MPPQHNKTQRRRGPSTPASESPSAVFQSDSVLKSTEDSLDALFAAETLTTFQQPWARLDRGARLDRLRKFVQSYPELTPAERASLLTAVLQAYELGMLKTKGAVEYDSVNAQVLVIHGLRERRTPSGLKVFRIDVPRVVPKTRKAVAGPGQTQGQNPGQIDPTT
jgi:hypothetical protein